MLICRNCGGEVKLNVIVERRILCSSLEDPLSGEEDPDYAFASLAGLECLDCGSSFDFESPLDLGHVGLYDPLLSGLRLWHRILASYPEIVRDVEYRETEEPA